MFIFFIPSDTLSLINVITGIQSNNSLPSGPAELCNVINKLKMKEESTWLHEALNKLEKVETRMKELEASIPAIMTTVVITALHDPEAVHQLVHTINEF